MGLCVWRETECVTGWQTGRVGVSGARALGKRPGQGGPGVGCGDRAGGYLIGVVSVGLCGKVTLRTDLKDTRHYPGGCLQEGLSREGDSSANALGQELVWCLGRARRQVWGTEQSEGDETEARPESGAAGRRRDGPVLREVPSQTLGLFQ